MGKKNKDVIAITNDKIAGFAAEWAHFFGFSILFDNPCEDLKAGEIINLSPKELAQQPFYKKLAEAINIMDQNELFQKYFFCKLPEKTYHITLFDGINSDNISKIFFAQQEQLLKYFNELPDSIENLANELNLKNVDWENFLGQPIEFKFEKISIREKFALVANLKPVDEFSLKIFERVKKKRRKLNGKIEECFGISTSAYPYNPHISLGYFANKELTNLALKEIAEWDAHFHRIMGNITIKFTSAHLYFFTDMITFIRG